MLTIKKDNVEKIVTAGAYEDLYKAMGYEVVGGNKVESKAAPVKDVASDSIKATEDDKKPAFTKNTDKKSDKVEK